MSSASVDVPPQTEPERSALATRRLCQALGLEALSPKELKHLTLALAESTTEEIARNPAFAERIIGRYRELCSGAGRAARRGATPGKKAVDDRLVPVGNVDPSRLSVYGPVDPYAVRELYGDVQLRTALADYTLAELKRSMAHVQERHPGTKPASVRSKAAIVDYIVEHVTSAQER